MTDSSPQSAVAPGSHATERGDALHDFWVQFDAHLPTLLARAHVGALDHPEFGPALRRVTPDALAAQIEERRTSLRRAVQGGDWEQYEASTRALGTSYARLGVSFLGWFDLTRGYLADMVPILANAYRDEPDRLLAAIAAMHAFADRLVRGLADAYFQAREEIARDAERELRESEARYRLLFEDSPLPMWVFDLETLRFLDVNEAAVTQYGYSREEFLRMTLADIRPPEEIPKLNSILAASLPRIQLDGVRHRRKDGSILDVEVRGHRFVLAGRQARLIVVNDVTERVRADDALRRTTEQLRQSQKMEAVGRLAGGVAHDFNNMLSVILSYATIGARSLATDDPLRTNFDEIRHAAERSASLTRQLLAFSRQQVLKPRLVDLNALVGDLHNMLERMLGEDIELRTQRAVSTVLVRTDPSQLHHLIMNLAVNARDAMPTGGQLTIGIEHVDLDADAARELGELTAGLHVVLVVSDTGEGMDAQTQSRVFEPFFTTKEVGKGTGLGLSTAFGIVRQSGGAITVTSELGEGATFRIYLPAATPHVEGASARPSPDAATTDGHETILLVEDEPALRLVLRRVLGAHGYRVLEAPGPMAALAIAEQHAGPIDLLLTDVVMPQMNGRQLADRLTPSRPEMRVLLMSGYTADVVIDRGGSGDATPFLAKPITPSVLLEKLRDLLDRRRIVDD